MPCTDEELLRQIDDALAEAARWAGPQLACRPGCTECCLGPFPITTLDARRLKDGLARLAEHNPARAAAVRQRAGLALEELWNDFPGDRVNGMLCGDDVAEEDFYARHASLPCPALDPASGRCALPDSRLLSCRTFGPPVTIGSERLPPCRLRFIGAPPDEIERCRVEPDPGAIEDLLLDELEGHGGQPGLTLVAWALTEPADRRGSVKL